MRCEVCGCGIEHSVRYDSMQRRYYVICSNCQTKYFVERDYNNNPKGWRIRT